MRDEITQTNTDAIKFDNDPEMSRWVDISIQNQTLVIYDICELLAKELNIGVEAMKSRYYHTWRPKGFQEYWYEKYKAYFKNRAGAKVYGKLDKLLDNARYIKDVVQAGEFLEGKTKDGMGMSFKDGNKEVKIVVTRGT